MNVQSVGGARMLQKLACRAATSVRQVKLRVNSESLNAMLALQASSQTTLATSTVRRLAQASTPREGPLLPLTAQQGRSVLTESALSARTARKVLTPLTLAP